MPLVTVALISANLAAYGLELAAGGLPVCEAYGFVPARFMASGGLELALSSMFLHDPERLAHIAGNMTFLAIFGTLVEGRLGHRMFAALYLAAGVFGALLHVLVDPTATDALVGASGAVFGVMAVAAVLRPRLLGFVVAFAGIELWRAFSGADASVSFGCHLGGLSAGFVFVSIMRALDCDALEGSYP